ncbi:hypothetical protein R1sor_007680 [Riccia sorocarpa]|uniref:Uncharacterized protein n=1 Tax=Riccia sorocarpa TaxID=122646 RepID=A0ABD3HTM9_9MARC
MTRPPRPKYPSDCKNYHELRKPGLAHTIRLPEELLQTYDDLKRSLGPRTTHADVIRFLFEAADPAIQAALQSANFWVVIDSHEDAMQHDNEEADPDIDLGDVADDSEESDDETVAEAGSIVEVRNNFTIPDSQPELNSITATPVATEAVNAFWSKELEKNHGTPDITARLSIKITSRKTCCGKEC